MRPGDEGWEGRRAHEGRVVVPVMRRRVGAAGDGLVGGEIRLRRWRRGHGSGPMGLLVAQVYKSAMQASAATRLARVRCGWEAGVSSLDVRRPTAQDRFQRVFDWLYWGSWWRIGDATLNCLGACQDLVVRLNDARLHFFSSSSTSASLTTSSRAFLHNSSPALCSAIPQGTWLCAYVIPGIFLRSRHTKP